MPFSEITPFSNLTDSRFVGWLLVGLCLLGGVLAVQSATHYFYALPWWVTAGAVVASLYALADVSHHLRLKRETVHRKGKGVYLPTTSIGHIVLRDGWPLHNEPIEKIQEALELCDEYGEEDEAILYLSYSRDGKILVSAHDRYDFLTPAA